MAVVAAAAALIKKTAHTVWEKPGIALRIPSHGPWQAISLWDTKKVSSFPESPPFLPIAYSRTAASHFSATRLAMSI